MNSHAYDLETVHDYLWSPSQQYGSVKYKLQVESTGIVSRSVGSESRSAAASRSENRTVARIPSSARAASPAPSTAPPTWSQNRRRRTGRCRYAAKRPSGAACNTDELSPLRSQLAQNGLKHSWFSRVIRLLHVPHRFLPSHTVFPRILFVLCLARHDRHLNCLLHSSHGYRTPYSADHGGIDMQSLHA